MTHYYGIVAYYRIILRCCVVGIVVVVFGGGGVAVVDGTIMMLFMMWGCHYTNVMIPSLHHIVLRYHPGDDDVVLYDIVIVCSGNNRCMLQYANASSLCMYA